MNKQPCPPCNQDCRQGRDCPAPRATPSPRHFVAALGLLCGGVASFSACGGGDDDLPFPHMNAQKEYMIYAGADENLNGGADEDLTAEDMRQVLEAHQEAIRLHNDRAVAIQRAIGAGQAEYVRVDGGYKLVSTVPLKPF